MVLNEVVFVSGHICTFTCPAWKSAAGCIGWCLLFHVLVRMKYNPGRQVRDRIVQLWDVTPAATISLSVVMILRQTAKMWCYKINLPWMHTCKYAIGQCNTLNSCYVARRSWIKCTNTPLIEKNEKDSVFYSHRVKLCLNVTLVWSSACTVIRLQLESCCGQAGHLNPGLQLSSTHLTHPDNSPKCCPSYNFSLSWVQFENMCTGLFSSVFPLYSFWIPGPR